MKILPMSLAAALAAGCFTAAPAGEFRWKVNAPSKVGMDDRFRFTVEAYGPDGAAAFGVPFVWRIDWVGVDGHRHQGRSFEEERINAKGVPGTATLRILAADGGDGLVEVAHVKFEVTPGRPAAD